MPSRNIVKQYDTNTYYHVYNRGVEKRRIFLDDEDYAVFLNLLKRYLCGEPAKDNKGREYDWLGEDVKLVAFCLMPNHFHLLLYQVEPTGMTKLMRAVCTSYATYFNRKHDRVGSLFQGHFKASIIRREAYLEYISRYIHRNPKTYRTWRWSSLPYWLDEKHADWVHPEQLKGMSTSQYLKFISDDEDYRESADELDGVLANR